MGKTLSENHAYIIELEISNGNCFEEESFRYMGDEKKYDCRNSAFIAAKKKLASLKKKYSDQTYRLVFRTETVVLIDL